jgi:hypothetical protein
MGAVDHLPGNGLARLQVQGGGQRERDIGINLHSAASATDALQAGGVVSLVAHIYVIA